jgi:hypothetical protein
MPRIVGRTVSAVFVIPRSSRYRRRFEAYPCRARPNLQDSSYHVRGMPRIVGRTVSAVFVIPRSSRYRRRFEAYPSRARPDLRKPAGRGWLCGNQPARRPACKIEYSGAEAGATKRGRSYWRCDKTSTQLRGTKIATVYILNFCFFPTESFRNAMRFPVRDTVSVS